MRLPAVRRIAQSAECRYRWSHHRLAAKMLLRAILDCMMEHERRDALRWIRSSQDSDYVFSFVACCRMLSLNILAVRTFAVNLAGGNIPGNLEPIYRSKLLELLAIPDLPLSGPQLEQLKLQALRKALRSHMDSLGLE